MFAFDILDSRQKPERYLTEYSKDEFAAAERVQERFLLLWLYLEMNDKRTNLTWSFFNDLTTCFTIGCHLFCNFVDEKAIIKCS